MRSGQEIGRVMDLLTRFDARWLQDAEISVPLDGASDRFAISLFFPTAELLQDFVAREQLGNSWYRETLAVHSTFDLVPRFWVKLSFAGAARSAVTRYFMLRPGMGNPLTTLRLLLRRLGASPPERFAAALEPYLGDARVGWFVSQQCASEAVRVRFSARLEPERRVGYLERMRDHDLLSEEQLQRHREVQAPTCDRVYVTLVAGQPDQCAVDFRVAAEPPRYLKCRFRDGQAEWTSYGPLNR